MYHRHIHHLLADTAHSSLSGLRDCSPNVQNSPGGPGSNSSFITYQLYASHVTSLGFDFFNCKEAK